MTEFSTVVSLQLLKIWIFAGFHKFKSAFYIVWFNSALLFSCSCWRFGFLLALSWSTVRLSWLVSKWLYLTVSEDLDGCWLTSERTTDSALL